MCEVAVLHAGLLLREYVGDGLKNDVACRQHLKNDSKIFIAAQDIVVITLRH
jgi:hypothetical protein